MLWKNGTTYPPLGWVSGLGKGWGRVREGVGRNVAHNQAWSEELAHREIENTKQVFFYHKHTCGQILFTMFLTIDVGNQNSHRQVIKGMHDWKTKIRRQSEVVAGVEYPFHSWEWSMSKFPCSLTRNMTSHSMENLAFHSLLRLKVIVLQILATSLIQLLFERLGEYTFWAQEWKGYERDLVPHASLGLSRRWSGQLAKALELTCIWI